MNAYEEHDDDRPVGRVLTRREVLGLLRQPSLDQQALSAALDRLRAAEMHVRTEVEHSAAAFVATLSPEDRMKMADAMERRGQARRRLSRWWPF